MFLAIPGAVRIDPRQLNRYIKEHRGGVDLAIDREVILYCASPGEATTARAALAMRQKGFEHVRPLAGGLQSWLDHGFPAATDLRILSAPEHDPAGARNFRLLGQATQIFRVLRVIRVAQVL